MNELRCREANQRMFDFLEFMVPEHVVTPLIRDLDSPIATQMNRVSILFVMIYNFDQLARNFASSELLEFINLCFTRFDEICSKEWLH